MSVSARFCRIVSRDQRASRVSKCPPTPLSPSLGKNVLSVLAEAHTHAARSCVSPHWLRARGSATYVRSRNTPVLSRISGF